MRGAVCVVASHPFAIPAIEATGHPLPLVYDAHNVEADLARALLEADLDAEGTTADVAERRDAVLGDVVRAESRTCAAAALVVTCSRDDAARLATLYDVAGSRVLVVPNGADTTAIPVSNHARREAERRAAGLGGTRLALFVGSRHPPNVEAALAIFAAARRLPSTTFLLVGSQCAALAGRQRPSNVVLLGVVDDATMAMLLGLVDVGLNPMRSGSGSNLKVPTYLAASLPVVTTPHGARGYDLTDGTDAVVCELGALAERVDAVLGDVAFAERLGAAGRRLAETRYDWEILARTLRHALADVTASRLPRAADATSVPT
jgi:glycosyltransferase involved in cell wall biosynthesis